MRVHTYVHTLWLVCTHAYIHMHCGLSPRCKATLPSGGREARIPLAERVWLCMSVGGLDGFSENTAAGPSKEFLSDQFICVPGNVRESTQARTQMLLACTRLRMKRIHR